MEPGMAAGRDADDEYQPPAWLEHNRVDRFGANQVDAFLVALDELCYEHGFQVAKNGVTLTEMPGSFTPPTIDIKVQKDHRQVLISNETATQPTAEIAKHVIAQINAQVASRR